MTHYRASGDETIAVYHDGPDKHGHYHFSLHWRDETGPFRPEPGPDGGHLGPIGFDRGQVFFAKPKPHLDRARLYGPVVEVDERPRRPILSAPVSRSWAGRAR